MKPLIVLLCTLAASAALAEGAYRWVDKDGKVQYSDAPPPATVRKFEQRQLGGNVIDSGGKLPYATRQAAREFPVTLYTTPDCGAGCANGLAYLRKRGIPFTEKPLTTPESIAEFQKVAKTNNPSVPGLAVGGKLQQGYEEGSWDSVLGAAGYPTSAAGN